MVVIAFGLVSVLRDFLFFLGVSSPTGSISAGIWSIALFSRVQILQSHTDVIVIRTWSHHAGILISQTATQSERPLARMESTAVVV